MSVQEKCPKCGAECIVGGIRMMTGIESRGVIEPVVWFEVESKKVHDSVACLERQLAQARERLSKEVELPDNEKIRADKAEATCDSLRLELQAEKHNHKKDNESLLARVDTAEAKVERLYRLMQETESHKRLERFAKRADERQKAFVKQNVALEAEAKRLREIWLSPGQDEEPGSHIIRILQVAAPFLEADRGETGYAAANIIERLAKQAEKALVAKEAPDGEAQG